MRLGHTFSSSLSRSGWLHHGARTVKAAEDAVAALPEKEAGPGGAAAPAAGGITAAECAAADTGDSAEGGSGAAGIGGNGGEMPRGTTGDDGCSAPASNRLTARV